MGTEEIEENANINKSERLINLNARQLHKQAEQTVTDIQKSKTEKIPTWRIVFKTEYQVGKDGHNQAAGHINMGAKNKY